MALARKRGCGRSRLGIFTCRRQSSLTRPRGCQAGDGYGAMQIPEWSSRLWALTFSVCTPNCRDFQTRRVQYVWEISSLVALKCFTIRTHFSLFSNIRKICAVAWMCPAKCTVPVLIPWCSRVGRGEQEGGVGVLGEPHKWIAAFLL